jgi:hypothetical protein
MLLILVELLIITVTVSALYDMTMQFMNCIYQRPLINIFTVGGGAGGGGMGGAGGNGGGAGGNGGLGGMNRN